MNAALLVLRLSIGILMLMHGIAKIQKGVEGVKSSIGNAGLPEALSYAVYLGEVIAPLMLIAGFRSRIASLLVAATMLVVMFFIYPEKLSQTIPTGAWALELQGLFLFGSIAIFLSGAGKYAVSTKNKWD